MPNRMGTTQRISTSEKNKSHACDGQDRTVNDVAPSASASRLPAFPIFSLAAAVDPEIAETERKAGAAAPRRAAGVDLSPRGDRGSGGDRSRAAAHDAEEPLLRIVSLPAASSRSSRLRASAQRASILRAARRN